MCLDLGTLSRIGMALADPTRRRVLVQLIDGPAYPAEMAEEFGTTRANLSNHLACLRECGLVTATAEGPAGPLRAGRPAPGRWAAHPGGPGPARQLRMSQM